MDQLEFSARFTHLDHIAGLQEVRRDVDDLVIHGEVTMEDQLPRRFSGWGESHAVHNIVKATFEGLYKLFAGSSGLFQGTLEVVPKLLFHQSVHAADLLFLAELNAVFRNFGSPVLAMLSRRIISLFNGTFFRIALRPLQEEFLSLSATQFAAGINIPSHCSPYSMTTTIIRGAVLEDGNRCVEWV
jgi:hypothetical protein